VRTLLTAFPGNGGFGRYQRFTDMRSSIDVCHFAGDDRKCRGGQLAFAFNMGDLIRCIAQQASM